MKAAEENFLGSPAPLRVQFKLRSRRPVRRLRPRRVPEVTGWLPRNQAARRSPNKPGEPPVSGEPPAAT